MKKIPNLELGGMSYADQIMAILETPRNVAGGTQYSEIVNTVPIIARIKEQRENDFILLENAEHKLVKERVTTAGFLRNTQEVLDMQNAVINAEKVVLGLGDVATGGKSEQSDELGDVGDDVDSVAETS